MKYLLSAISSEKNSENAKIVNKFRQISNHPSETEEKTETKVDFGQFSWQKVVPPKYTDHRDFHKRKTHISVNEKRRNVQPPRLKAAPLEVFIYKNIPDGVLGSKKKKLVLNSDIHDNINEVKYRLDTHRYALPNPKDHRFFGKVVEQTSNHLENREIMERGKDRERSTVLLNRVNRDFQTRVSVNPDRLLSITPTLLPSTTIPPIVFTIGQEDTFNKDEYCRQRLMDRVMTMPPSKVERIVEDRVSKEVGKVRRIRMQNFQTHVSIELIHSKLDLRTSSLEQTTTATIYPQKKRPWH